MKIAGWTVELSGDAVPFLREYAAMANFVLRSTLQKKKTEGGLAHHHPPSGKEEGPPPLFVCASPSEGDQATTQRKQRDQDERGRIGGGARRGQSGQTRQTRERCLFRQASRRRRDASPERYLALTR